MNKWRCLLAFLAMAVLLIGSGSATVDECGVCQHLDPNTGLCVIDEPGSPCDDGNACTTDETCMNGTCVIGAALDCDDDNDCTDDSCNPDTGCVNENNAAPCEDDNACTTNDTCSEGTCAGGAALDCDDRDACTDDSCDPALGCVYTPMDCDDGNLCTVDTCKKGKCEHKKEVCKDKKPCDKCDPATGECYAPGKDNPNMMCGDACVNTDKDNQNCGECGNACGMDEKCSKGVCVPKKK